MTGQIIVGLAGRIGAGKTSLADRLARRHGFVKVGFGDAIKDEVATYFIHVLKAHLRLRDSALRQRDDAGVVAAETWRQYVHTLLWETRDEFSRAFLQAWGMVRRQQDAQYWVNAWQQRILRFPLVVNENVRMLSEAEAIRAMGGWLVQVRRHAYPVVTPDDPTETGLADFSDFDLHVLNDDGVDDLDAEADRIAKAVGCVEKT